jgi:hypothetical protein
MGSAPLDRAVTAGALLLVISGAAAVAASVTTSDPSAPQPGASAAGSIDDRPLLSDTSKGAPVARRYVVLRGSRPVRLGIPSLGTSAVLDVVGLNADRSLQVPAPGPNYGHPAWYSGSPSPGELGPAVIIGHVDSVTGPSVFFRLGALQPGDRIEVSRADGSMVEFSVTGVRRYAKSRFPTQLVFGRTAYPALRLITCGGPFDRATGHYRDDIVVFAALSSAR